MFLAHTHAFITAERDYRMERSNARLLQLTARRISRRRRQDAAERARSAACAAGAASTLDVRSA
jgi:5-methylcytosine-specific restriction endonuclease McrBC regulatory subunit McrC